MEGPIVFNIQKYSVHDGDGIRTTVFFKGCPLRCSWCHNPESQDYEKELMYYIERCILCGYCVASCPNKSLFLGKKGVGRAVSQCHLCATCVEGCIKSGREIVGKHYKLEELIKEIEKDRMFYEESGGGVTLSGGEVLAQNMDYIEALLKALKKKGYHTAIDTCGYAPWAHFERVLEYTDTFLYDIKHMDSNKHKQLTGVDNKLILENLHKLVTTKATIYLRIPLIQAINDDEKNIADIIECFKEGLRPQKIFLLPYHPTGMDKYERLGRTYKGVLFSPPSHERMEAIKAFFCENGFKNIQIGG